MGTYGSLESSRPRESEHSCRRRWLPGRSGRVVRAGVCFGWCMPDGGGMWHFAEINRASTGTPAFPAVGERCENHNQPIILVEYRSTLFEAILDIVLVPVWHARKILRRDVCQEIILPD